ncbi:hypothetical protein PTSG_04678 [Salpingoeca rosetta]|uniref:Uncharacterized protein n=1 Tax=Salpingoeca rosetta (strain ATCC 50818 / BSB-021) TaxID=946362 RepID=F2U841_SALR5|nr:uncharacterized protein PTSG_04678 [Salpingoeca rosetta]EGD72946.1 hypothetical protein PTSG_04678 [Salpingoeca rosetta]|eukprot:XP_004994768.1 hypothetical protein PTSG_04678 [Salpingoeca rosetta]
MAKKKVTKKKKKGAASKKKAASGPSEPIIPKVCTNCGALYTPVKEGSECALCVQAKDTAVLFASLSASLASTAAGSDIQDALAPLPEDGTTKEGAEGSGATTEAGDGTKKKKLKKKGSTKKKKKSSISGTKKKKKSKK